jgi:hypothetical protein
MMNLGVLAGPDMDIIIAAQGGDPTAIMAFDTARYQQAIRNARDQERDYVDQVIVLVDPSTVPEQLRRRPQRERDAAEDSIQPLGGR